MNGTVKEAALLTVRSNAGLGILPCPFCGGKAEFGVIPHNRKYADDDECQINHDFGGEFIQCSNNGCAASSMLVFPTMEDAKPLLIEKWNRRVPNVK